MLCARPSVGSSPSVTTGPPSTAQLRHGLCEKGALLPKIERIHAENYSVYGAGRIHHAKLRASWQISRDQVSHLMRIAGVQGVNRGRKPSTTRPARDPGTRPDLVEGRFTAEDPNQL